MQTVRAVVSTPIRDSPRVQQIGGMFDLGIPRRVETRFEAPLPDASEDWQIGAIIGPSGSGKSTIARAAFAQGYWNENEWPSRKAIIDCLGNRSTKEITGMLTAVGFSSPPAWIRPYASLSNGERFRANLARALLRSDKLLCYDEFSSVVDRQVARIGSFAVSKAIRKGIVTSRFVAVTCHYDILPWLSPDWVLDTSDWTLCRRRLRRPQIHLAICRCLPDAWVLFKRHHYLSAEMCHRAARCFLGIVNDQPVAFASIMPCPGLAGASRISRIVVLPDWQGVGIGRAFCRALGELYAEQGRRLHLRTGHAMMIRALSGDPCWQLGAVYPYGSSRPIGELSWKFAGYEHCHHVSRRPGVSFVYVGPPESAKPRHGLDLETGKKAHKKADLS